MVLILTKFSIKKNNRNDLKKILIVGRQVYAKNGLNLMKGLSLFESRNDWLPSITRIGRRDDDKRSSKDIKS